MHEQPRRGNLVIARRKGESIQIGDDVTVEIVDVTPGKVRIKIRAPVDVPVLRHDAIVTVPAQSR